jgi:signal transduction histidine kinase
MGHEKKAVWRGTSPENKRHLLQPVAAVIVIVIFAALVLSLGILYLGRLDNALVGFMETRGFDIVRSIEKVAQENLDSLYHSLRREKGREAFAPLTDEAFSPQDMLIRGLVELAREVDSIWKTEALSDEALRRIAERESLWLIAVLDKEGAVIFQSREFPESTRHRAPPVTSRHEEIIIDLFNRLGKPDEVGYIALRRKDGSGTIVVALDDRGLRHWSTKIAIKKAIEEIGWGEGLAYLVVTDRYQRVLGKSGKVAQGSEREDIHIQNILAGSLKVASRKITSEEGNILEIMTPVRLDDKIVGLIRIGLIRDRTDAILKENNYAVFVSTALILMIGIMTIWFLYQSQNSHLARMEEMERKLRQAERLSALGQLAAGVAHEIRNPLNAISMATQRVQREYVPDDPAAEAAFRRITGIIRDEIRRLNEIIEDFLTFSKSRRLEFHNHSVVEVLQKLTNLIREEAESRNISIRTTFTDNHVTVSMDINKMKQALYNIMKNAMESIENEGTITVSSERANDNTIRIKVTDTGSGLTEDEMHRIFNPEYTTKEKGLGLGLALAHEIIRGHRGEISVESEVGRGSTFEVILPIETA